MVSKKLTGLDIPLIKMVFVCSQTKLKRLSVCHFHFLTLLRSFYGLYTYYKDFIPDFGATVATLTEGTKAKGETNYETTKEMEVAFSKVKEAIVEDRLLLQPVWDKIFNLYTDASGIAAGYLLDVEHGPIGKKFNSMECKCKSYELEAYAVV